MAANDIWHSEIWPDVQSSRPSEARTTAKPMPVVYWFTDGRGNDERDGDGHGDTRHRAGRRRQGARRSAGSELAQRPALPGVASLARGTSKSAATSTRKGIWV